MSQDERNGGIDRRKFIASGAAVSSAALAGCPGASDGGEETGEGTQPGDEPDATPTPPPETIPKGGTFVMALPSPPTGLNPLTTSSAYSVVLYEGLVQEYGTFLDPFDYKVRPWVYTDWTAENTDSDQPDVFFNVRDGLTFNDGEDLAVEDVVFTYNYLLENQPGKFASAIDPVKTVEKAQNEYDVHMKFSEPFATYASTQLSVPILPEHIWSQVDNYQKYTPGDMVDQGRPVGAGMGSITTYRPDTAVEVELRDPDEYQLSNLQWLEDSDRYATGGPFLDKIQFKVFTNESTRVQNFLNGNVDSIYSNIPPDSLENVENTSGREVVEGTDTGYGFVAFNLRSQPFDDLTFRQMMGFLWDDIYWVRRLNRNQAIEGDFVAPPGYSAIRPESASEDAEMLTDPAAQAYSFRQSSPGVPDYAGIRKFLTDGQIITGEGGTYVGQEYPGSLTGVTAGQTEPKYDYTFSDDVQDPILQDAGAQKEIRIDGQRVREMKGGPIRYFSYPPGLLPRLNEMDKAYVNNLQKLGVPVSREIITFNQLIQETFIQESFDITHLGWGDTSPFGVSSLRGLFDSSQADDHSVSQYPKGNPNDKKNDQVQLNNFTGYGLFDDATADDLIEEAQTTFNRQDRLDAVRRAIEQIYLDMPYMVFQYSKLNWPVNSADFAGWEGGIAGPGSANLATQWLNIYQQE